MQLVYLWVRDYKNLRNAEFNFGGPYAYHHHSPDINRHHLSREPNPDYIPDLFNNGKMPGILNISAIVGDNGSGKSTLLQLLRKVCYESNGQEVMKGDSFFSYILVYEPVGPFDDKEIPGVFYNQQVFDPETMDSDTLTAAFHFVPAGTRYSPAVYYSPFLDFNSYHLPEADVVSDFDASPDFLFFEPDRKKEQLYLKDAVWLFRQREMTLQMELVNYLKRKSDRDLPVALPKDIDVIIRTDREESFLLSDVRGSESDMAVFVALTKRYKKERDRLFSKINKLPEPEKVSTARELFVLHGLYNLYAYYSCTVASGGKLRNLADRLKADDEIIEKNLGAVRNDFMQVFQEYLNEQTSGSWDTFVVPLIKLIRDFSPHIKRVEIEKGCLYLKAGYTHVAKFTEKYFSNIAFFRTFSTTYRSGDFIYFEWQMQSSGEHLFLKLFSYLFAARDQLAGALLKLMSRPEQFRMRPVLLLIDEGEIGFHMQWQKEYVSHMSELLNIIFDFGEVVSMSAEPPVQVIFTSHSPVTLSDIPSYNIVYLEKAADSSCTVLNNAERPKHSFAANIHELMASSFYLKDGLMGRFAEARIKEILDWYKRSDNEAKKEAVRIKQLIAIIDDPLLQIKLSEMYAIKMGEEDIELQRLLAQQQYIENRIREKKKK